MTDLTTTEAWKRGEREAKEALADAKPKLPDPLERGKAILAEAAERHSRKREEPIRYCCVEACGMTCSPHRARCWVHEGAT